MHSLSVSMTEFQQQLHEGRLQQAYSGLIEYFRYLRRYMADTHPDYSVSANVYQGTMDMTYFAVAPMYLQHNKLKCAIVFDYGKFEFEVWLSGVNRRVQQKYWALFKDRDWQGVFFSSDPTHEDYILGRTLVTEPDFDDLEMLTSQIDEGVQAFLTEVEKRMALPVE